MVLHIDLIVLHAAFATVAFGLGCALMAVLPESARSRRFIVYYCCVWAAVAFLVAAVLVDWPQLPLVKRVAFGGLSLLGLYLLWRTDRARASLLQRRAGWSTAFVGHIGFVLISLFDGFCIVTAIDLHLPPLVIALVAVLGVVAGVVVIRRVARREQGRSAAAAGIGAR
ncbi:hypothetical protein GCM10022381_32250 [Leifsonia kafniensis]|uniref:DUF2306 domain-containing protein n=1 Tax=Leifsonia kafniensis TaxID=475957 RepID=A0ABP7KX19_9MICO